jgi:hypothetical protein
MLEELLKYEKLGNSTELSFFLLKVLPLARNQKMSDLRAYCTANHYTIGQSVDGILKLLEFMELISVSGDEIFVQDEFFSYIKRGGKDYDKYKFTKTLLVALKNADSIESIFPSEAIKLDGVGNVFYVKENFIPLQYTVLRNLLISLGFFMRGTSLGQNLLAINAEYTNLFLDEVIKHIKETNQSRRRKSLQLLKERQAHQELLGKEAEIFVLEFEQRRLRGHRLFDSIKRISEEYVNAGYDIESFNDTNSFFADRFIEVKSYSGRLEFYWSVNEVELAKDLADKYFLYLVDRSKLTDSGYSPKIIQDPYQNVFENNLWIKESQMWKFSIEENQ